MAQEWVAHVASRGDNRIAAVAHDGTVVELRMVAPKVYGNLLQHLTGSKHHNVALREAAVRAGLKVSEYGIEDVESGEVLACEDEAEVYARLGMAVDPAGAAREPRRDRGGSQGTACPTSLEIGQIRGDLHTHTDWSDGKATLEKMVAGGPGARLRLHEHHRPLAVGRVRHGPRRRPAARPGRARARAGRDARARLHAPGRRRGRHPPRRVAGLLRRAPRRARRRRGERARLAQAVVRRPDEADLRRAREPARRHPRPPDGPAHRKPRAEPARYRGGHREGGRDPDDHRGELRSPSGSTCATRTSGWRSRPGRASRSTPMPTRSPRSTTSATASRPPAAAGRPPPMS